MHPRRMKKTNEFSKWSRGIFGRAQMGDARRTARLVEMGAAAASRPDGRVSHVISCAADRQAAYDFLENSAGSHRSIAEAMGTATASGCRGLSGVVVPVDATSFSLLNKHDDPGRAKDFGLIGSAKDGVRGVHIVSAQVLSPDGVVQGVGDMRWWSRGLRPDRSSRSTKARRSIERTELGRWTEAIQTTQEAFQEEAPGVVPWFQLDRGGDSWRLMLWLHTGKYRYTVRARADRNVLVPPERVTSTRRARRGVPPVEPAKTALRRQPCLGTLKITLRPREGHPSREVTLHVRALAVVLALRDPCAWQPIQVPLWAVWVREMGPIPRGAERVEWLLWTSVPVLTFDDAALVVNNYVLRWRIEEWHRAWKSDCNAEQIVLQSVEAVSRWGTILGAVAARIERLKLLARTEPDQLAERELGVYELRALVTLKRMEARRTESIEDSPTLERAVRWIADLGGYDGRPSARPPGATVIARGMRRVTLVAAVLENMEHEEK